MSASNGTGAGLGLDFLSIHNRHPHTIETDSDTSEKSESDSSTASKSNAGLSSTRREADPSTRISTMPSSNSGMGATLLHEPQAFLSANQQSSLSRHGTLLSINAGAGRNVAELKSILGSSSSRLKPGAALLPVPGHHSSGAQGTSLEQAKSRVRVDVDIILDSKICVQGGYLQGHIKVHVQKSLNGETPIMISDGKVRVIGFESISNELNRYPFYQCSSPLSTITVTSGRFHGSHQDRDAEGFAQAIEGEHRLPFSMYLPMSADYGVPKGVLQAHAGVAVRYIAMVSIKVKDSVSDSYSIAHFYRDCEIWPRLNPSTILAPAERPVLATTLKSLFLGGSGKVDLTASVHRLYWIAGQQCFVKVNVTNASKKMVNSLALALIRSTVVFKPERHPDVLDDGHNMDPDACQTSTTQKRVAESVLQLGQRGTRGHASAKGWWTGVAPGDQLEFSHSILLPPDALSVTRSRLLEVDYSIRVTLSAGALRTADIQASLPIRIVNFLSVDPPPSCALTGAPMVHSVQSANAPLGNHPGQTGAYDPYVSNSRTLESLPEADEEWLPSSGPSSQSTSPQDDYLATDDAYEGIYYDDSDESYPPDTGEYEKYDNQHEELGDLTMYEDDADEIVPSAIHVDPEYENAPRFADLYHASVHDDLYSAGLGFQGDEPQQAANPTTRHQTPTEASVREHALPKHGSHQEHHSDSLRPNSRPPVNWTRPTRPQGPSSFAQRVQIKLEAAAATSNLRPSLGDDSVAQKETPFAAMDEKVVTPSTDGQTGILGATDGMPHYMRYYPT
ncbi:hypothetical protein FPV67DRAFT_84009 [Lyophyllum atratum]|nr:hypothetical protein FPV67DRAFT_84009 [Lyophyllum atratum]